MRLLAVMAGALLWCGAAAADPADPKCPVPEGLGLSDLALPAARAALEKTGKLVILTLGGNATSGAVAGNPDATYPARLQAALAAALPGHMVNVVNKGAGGHSTASLLQELPASIQQSGSSLVIWASGAREAAHNADIDEYIANLQRGIDAIRQAGADAILVDLQYAPSIARIEDTGAYRDALYGTAVDNDVPVLRRYELMMQWSDDGVMNFDAQDPAERREVAQHLFACLAAVLAPAIAEAVR